MSAADLQQLLVTCDETDCPLATKLGCPVRVLHWSSWGKHQNHFATALTIDPLSGLAPGSVYDNVYVLRKDGQLFTEADFWTLFVTMVRLADRFYRGPVSEAELHKFADRLQHLMAQPIAERVIDINNDSEHPAHDDHDVNLEAMGKTTVPAWTDPQRTSPQATQALSTPVSAEPPL